MKGHGPVIQAALLATVAAWAGACAADDDRSPSWEYISPALFQPSCATVSCHSRATAVAGLDFSDPDRGYTSLTGLLVVVDDPNGGRTVNPRPLLTPFIPAQSRVINMLRARDTTRMPPDRPLSEADIRLVERWILDGATKTIGGTKGDAGINKDAGAPSDGRADRVQDGIPNEASTGDGAPDRGADSGAGGAQDGSAERAEVAATDSGTGSAGQ